MNVIGRITNQQLYELRQRGLTPQDAVRALLQEAKSHHPSETIIIQKAWEFPGFNIVAV